ncbi:MAG: efflux RND transporter periplasmic adaptor subunit [Bacteroidales bacterium]|nr:efflux RND transporter periplasmic adaptor subunit [Bacteroidales bacterium]
MNPRKILLYLSIVVAVLIIFLIIGKKAGWIGNAMEYEVTVEKAMLRNITEVITANGKIQPETDVKITPDVAGEIVEITIKDGNAVKKGQFLLKIKPDIYISARDRAIASLNGARANLANYKALLVQAESRFEQARLAYERNKILWKEKTISAAEWEASQSSFKIAKADVEAAHKTVEAAEYSIHSAEATLNEANESLLKTSIFAPMDGIITALYVEKGERVVGTSMMTGTDLLQLADLDRMEVLTEVNENDIIRVNLNDSALVEIDAYPDRKFKGVVTEIANSAKTTGTTTDQVTNFEVKIFLLKSSYQDLIDAGNKFPFRPGMSASVDIVTDSKTDILTVPLQAVTRQADTLQQADSVNRLSDADEYKEVVFVYENQKVKMTTVKTGIQDITYIEILSGLSEGQEIVTAPYHIITKKLKDGSSVKKVSKEELLKTDKKKKKKDS